MNCREFTEFLADYFAGELADPERDVFDEHLSVCSDCQAYLQTYRFTVRASRLAMAPDNAPPPEVPEDLIRAVLAARPK